MKFMNILRDPDENENAGGEGLQDTLEKGLTPQEGAEGGEVEKKDEAPSYDPNNPASDRRAKAKYEGEERRAGLADPEFDLGYEEEEGKGTRKEKLSEIKKTAKWLHENRNMIAGAIQIRKLSGENPEFGKLISTVLTKPFEGGKYNAEFVTKTLASFDVAAGKVEDKIDDKTDEIKEAEAALAELDPESGEAKILTKNINALKRTRSELTQALGKIDQLSKKFEGLEKTQTEFISKTGDAERSVEVKRLSQVFDTEIGALTDKNKADGYKFIDDDDAKEFDQMVRNMVSSQAEKIENLPTDAERDAAFVRAIKDSAKAAYETLRKRNEKYVNDYLRKKTPQQKAPEKKEGEEKKPDMTLDTLADNLERELSAKK